MTKYLLDTNICIHFLKGEYHLDTKIKSIGLNNCFISEITVLELLFGVENSDKNKKKQNKQIIETFIKLFQPNIIPINSCFNVYAKEKARLKKSGQLIGEFDMLIGSSAIVNNMTIVTRNTKHFKHLSRIEIENWIDNVPKN